MGVVNVTPDSFSDGGKFNTPEEALRRARNLIEEGADILDVGGESTRPDATPISWEEEWRRIEPVLRGLSPLAKGGGASIGRTGTVPVISVDTYHPETAERALDLGVGIVNCVYSSPIPKMLELCARYGAELVLPSREVGTGGVRGAPALPGDAVAGTGGVRGAPALPGDAAAGIVPVYWDPMIGFGTTREEDLALLRGIPELCKRGRVLIGASRKRIVKRLVGEKTRGKDLAGNLTIAVWAALHGASVVRVHDVAETVQALRVLGALEK